jgi:hypothetical protein
MPTCKTRRGPDIQVASLPTHVFKGFGLLLTTLALSPSSAGDHHNPEIDPVALITLSRALNLLQQMMGAFRPCIDLHAGKVKQIVGSSLTDDGKSLVTNFESEMSAKDYAR